MLEDFALRPPEGQALGVTELLQAVRESPLVVRLPAARHSVRIRPQYPDDVFIVCASADQARRVRDWVEAGNTLERFIGTIAFLEITEDAISVYQAAPAEVVGQVGAFLLPLLRAQGWRVFTERGDETATFARTPGALFS